MKTSDMPTFEEVWNKSQLGCSLADYESGCRAFYSFLLNYLDEAEEDNQVADDV